MINRAALVSILLALLAMSGCATMGASPLSGKPAPEFRVMLTTGEEVSLASLRGRPVLLSFGASWCTHCKGEIPALKASFEKYRDKAHILIVVIKSPEAEVRSTIRQHDIRFMVGLDPEGDVARLYGVKGLPQAYFIDRDGMVAGDYFGAMSEGAMSDRIEGLLGGR